MQMIGLIPVIEARAHNVAQRSAAQRTNPDKWEKAVQKAARREGNAVLARWGCQRWKSYVPFLQMPVWVVASAVLRGLLPGRSGGGEKAEAVVVDAAAAATAGKEPVAEVASDWIVRAFGGISQAPSEELVAQLQTEGLWAVDLTASDPTLLLPFALWAAVSANAGFMYMTSPATGKWAVRVSRIMMVLLFAMGYVASSAPAALVLYWVTSAAWSLWVNVALHFAWPLPKKVNKCKVQGPEGVKKEGKKERN